ncbi:MAG TPA: hypothetical protein VN703_02890 [Candidatus Sulfopaludibacter sp.]|nr:hypothetical protein [Candidatus Sulfopaludibacter sp.]
MPPSTVFATGVIENSPDGVYMTNDNLGKKLRWVAKRGRIHDWAIYIHWAEKEEDWIRDYGDKVTSPSNIKKLIPCDDAAFSMYRY